MQDKIMGFLKQCGRIVFAVVVVLSVIIGLYASLWIAEFMGVAGNFVKLAEALLSSVVVAVGAAVGFFVWLAKRYDREIREFLRKVKRAKGPGGWELETHPDRQDTAEKTPTGKIPQDVSIEEIQEKAKIGDAEAQNQIGLALFYGGRGTRGEAEAVKFWQLAAKQGYTEAQYNLGVCYDKGTGVAAEQPKMRQSDGVSAVPVSNNRICKAQCNLAGLYHEGWGVPGRCGGGKVGALSRRTRIRAKAQHNLGYCYEVGRGVTKDLAESVKWYRCAAEQGFALSQFSLGVSYRIGEALSKMMWKRQNGTAVPLNRDMPRHNSILAQLYAKGEGVEQDILKR